MIVDRIVDFLSTGYQKAWYAGDPLPGSAVDTATKIRVDNNVAMTYSACWSATLALSDPISLLPCPMYQRQDSGERQERRDHELFDILNVAPNAEMGSMAFRGTMTPQLINNGNAFAEIERKAGRIVALWPIHWTRLADGDNKIRYYRDERDRIWWLVRNDDGTETPIPDRDMFHIVGALSEDGITGKGVIRQAAESIGLGIATERFGGTFFGNGARPSSVLTHPTKLSPDGKQALRKEWQSVYGGSTNANKVAILEGGTTLTPFSVDNDSAQFLETRQYNIQEICRWYRVPPHMLADLSRATFSNIEHLALEFVTHSLMPWLGRWEEAIRRKLLSEQERRDGLYAEFNVEGLLRGDSKARGEFYKLMIGMGVYTINDALRKENMESAGPMGDTRFVPANMLTLEKAIKQEPQDATQNGDGEDGNEDKKPPGDDQMGRLAAIVAANKRRLTTKLRNHAVRLAAKPNEYMAWVDDSPGEWWLKYAEQLREGGLSEAVTLAWINGYRRALSKLTESATSAEELVAAVEFYFQEQSNG